MYQDHIGTINQDEKIKICIILAEEEGGDQCEGSRTTLDSGFLD